MKKNLFALILFAAVLTAQSFSQTISWGTTPAGYDTGSIMLNDPFAGAITSTADPDVIYVSTGSSKQNKITKVTLSTGVCEDVTSKIFASIWGMTVLPTGELIIIDNDVPTSTVLSGEAVFIAKDKNSDGDFKDPGEIGKLIDPILVEGAFGGFSGAQARTVPAGGISGVPGGSLMFMDADASKNGDLFVVNDPTTSSLAAYYPANSSFWKGFDYNGGFDFDSHGNIYLGAVTDYFHGEIYALKNTNADTKILSGEWNTVITTDTLTYTSIGDLIIDKEDDVIFAAMTYPSPSIMSFKALASPLTEKATPGVFATLNAGWVSALMLNSKSLSFEPDTNASHATLILGGSTTSWISAKNLLLLTPRNISSVDDWQLLK